VSEAIDDVVSWARELEREIGEGRTERERYVLSCLRSSLDRYEAHRERLEQLGSERLARKHVSRGVVGFTYRPTPPSGPAPKDGSSGRADSPEDKKT
jgi:hypothetical protein